MENRDPENRGPTEGEFALEQYRLYMDRLQQASQHRNTSFYFFVTVNIVLLAMVMFLSVVNLPAPNFRIEFALVVPLMVVAISLNLYWRRDTRETRALEEARFRVIMDMEKRAFGGGIISDEWDIIGDYAWRRSPVFYVALGRYLPYVFVAVYLSIFFIEAISFFLSGS